MQSKESLEVADSTLSFIPPLSFDHYWVSRRKYWIHPWLLGSVGRFNPFAAVLLYSALSAMAANGRQVSPIVSSGPRSDNKRPQLLCL